jgi:hypothetical protein
MLRNVKGMLMPIGTELSLIDFMDSQKRDGVDTDSKERWIVLSENESYAQEGYLSYHESGEVRIRANSIAYSRQLHLYAWDKVVAMLPCNKSSKQHWIHPKVATGEKEVVYCHSWHKAMIEERLHPLIKLHGEQPWSKTSLLT